MTDDVVRSERLQHVRSRKQVSCFSQAHKREELHHGGASAMWTQAHARSCIKVIDCWRGDLEHELRSGKYTSPRALWSRRKYRYKDRQVRSSVRVRTIIERNRGT